MDTARFCNQLGKLMFIIMEDNLQAVENNITFKEILQLGAIPINRQNEIDLIIRSLV
jgi:hypothetical protein